MTCALILDEVAERRQRHTLPWELEKFHGTLNEKVLFRQRRGLCVSVVEGGVFIGACVCVVRSVV